jgi:hypothetical protein
MARGQTWRADLASHPEQRLEFYIGVAIGARDGRAAGEILLDERANDVGFEMVFEIYNVVREVEMLCDALGVVDVVDGAAAVPGGSSGLQVREAALIPELHGQSDYAAILFLKQNRNDRAVDPATHSDSDGIEARFVVQRKGVELEFNAHGCRPLLLYWMNDRAFFEIQRYDLRSLPVPRPEFSHLSPFSPSGHLHARA